MPRHIHEQTEVELICLLKDGKTGAGSVEFVVFHDTVEAARVQGAVAASESAPAGKSASAKYTPPKVADNKTSYLLTYKAIADGEDYKSDDEIQVWPREGKLTSRNEDDSKPLKNFKFKVMQNGAPFGAGLKTSNADPSVETFKLDKGFPFVLEGVAPYEIVGDPEAQAGKLRELKSKGKVNFVAEFISPKRPADGQVRQWVNLDADPAKKGADGLRHTVEVSVGVLGDRNPAGVPNAELIGAAGIFVFVNVKFSGPGNKKSLRNSPKTDLVAGLNLVDRSVVKDGVDDGEWEIKGKVELAAANGVGVFKLELGEAGGDSCVVRIGSTVACADADLSFTNWRKLWYEILAPDFMELEDHLLTDGRSLRDFAAGGLANLKTSGDATFIEYEIFKSHSFTQVQASAACPGSVMKREFFQRAAGPAQVYLLTDYTYQTDPKPFDGGKGRRSLLLKACDINLYNDGPATHADQDSTFDVQQADADFAFPDGRMYWSPVSAWGGGGGADSIKSIGWKARIADPGAFRGPPTCAFAVPLDDQTASDDGDAVFTLDELTQHPSACRVLFKNPMLGNTATTLDSSAKGVIDGWLAPLCSDAAVRPHGFKLQFRLTGKLGNARRTSRVEAINSYLQTRVAAAPALYKHGGLKPDGTPRSGVLDWHAVVNMDRSHHQQISVDLPSVNADDPGTLAGALSDVCCPIILNLKWEQQRAANGLASNGQILVKWGINCPKCITDTFLHEAGHQFKVTETGHGLPGIPAAKDTTANETVVAYQTNGTQGHYYTGHGHSGGHCAYGLSDADKALPSYGGRTGTCTLYGEGPRDDGRRRRLSFCPQCQDILRATPLE